MGCSTKSNLPLVLARGIIGLMLCSFHMVHAQPGDTLVLLDTLMTKDTHSDFFALLTGKNLIVFSAFSNVV